MEFDTADRLGWPTIRGSGSQRQPLAANLSVPEACLWLRWYQGHGKRLRALRSAGGVAGGPRRVGTREDAPDDRACVSELQTVLRQRGDHVGSESEDDVDLVPLRAGLTYGFLHRYISGENTPVQNGKGGK